MAARFAWPVPALLALLALPLAVLCAGVEEARDGYVHELVFSEGMTELTYSYRCVDHQATLSLYVYPHADNKGNVSTSVCLDEGCNRLEKVYPGFFSKDFPVASETGDKDLGTLDLTEYTLYFKVHSSSSAHVFFSVTSAVVLTNGDSVEISEGDADDDYDWEANNYQRYYRAFNCYDDGATVSLTDQSGLAHIYVNGWNPSHTQTPGRPTEADASCKSESQCGLSELGDASRPGWVFITLDVKDLFTNSQNSNHSVKLKAELEVPVSIGTTGYVDLDVGVYDGCSRLLKFHPADWLEDTEEEDDDEFNLVFVAMSTESYEHEGQSLVGLTIGDAYPLQDASRKFSLSDNVYVLDSSEINYYTAKENGYIAIYLINQYTFPQPIEGIGEILNFRATMIKNGNVITAGLRAITTTLRRATAEEGCGANVEFSRLAFDTAAINKPRYALSRDVTNGDIKCDYVVVATPNANEQFTITPSIRMGVYTDAGDACIPYRQEPNDETDVDNIETDYPITSKTLVRDKETTGKYDISYLAIRAREDGFYHQGSAYILDVYNGNVNPDDATELHDITIAAYPRWNLKRNIQYNMELNGSTNFDFFVLDLESLEHGLNFLVEPTFSTETNIQFSIYASFFTEVPDKDSLFKAEGVGKAELTIDPKDLAVLEDIGDYRVFVAVDTIYTGEVMILFSESTGFGNILEDAKSTKVEFGPNTTNTAIRVHSSKFIASRQMVFYFDGTSNKWDEFADGTKIEFFISANVEPSYLETNDIISDYIELNKDTHKFLYEAKLTDEDKKHPDYFIYATATFPTGETKSLSVTVFAEKMEKLNIETDNIFTTVDTKTPMLGLLNTKNSMDYTLKVNIMNQEPFVPSYTVRVCADSPSLSTNEPKDLLNNKVRQCITKDLEGTSTLEINLFNDSLYNGQSTVDDLSFILSAEKYITIYPKAGLAFTDINVFVYEDEYIRSDQDDEMIIGEYEKVKYFKLNILSTDSFSDNDMLNFRFSGSNPIDYCLCKEPHAAMEQENCIVSHISTSPTDYQADFNVIVPINSIDKSYSSQLGTYAYFAYKFPAAEEGNLRSMTTQFNSIVIHYLEQISNSTDNFNMKSYYSTLVQGKTLAYYTKNVILGSPFRFAIIPDVTDSSSSTAVSPAYTNSIVGIKMTTSINGELPDPSFGNSDVYGAGILIKDYLLNKEDLVDGENIVIITARFISERSTVGLYKAGFVGASEGSTHFISNMKFLKANQPQKFSSSDPTASRAKSRIPYSMFYYPHATSSTVLVVNPCAGFPGLYQSYITPVPGHNTENVDVFPEEGYTPGNPYFNFFSTVEGEEINMGTGFVFNATAHISSYNKDDDALEKYRWDAEAKLITKGTTSPTGGPYIINSKIKLVKTHGSELTLDVGEALPLYTTTHLEYAVFAIPAVEDSLKVDNFDASPETYCGLLEYGFPLTVKSSKFVDIKWKQGSSASASDPDHLNSTIRLITNFAPSKYKYKDGVRPNYYDPSNDKSLSGKQQKEAKKLFNINVIVKEVAVDSDGDETLIGYSSYEHIQLSVSGGIPITEGGLLGWELTLIILAVLVVAGSIASVVVCFIIKKKKELGYENVDRTQADIKETGRNDQGLLDE